MKVAFVGQKFIFQDSISDARYLLITSDISKGNSSSQQSSEVDEQRS